MKVKLNTLTNYEGCTFKLGDEVDIPLNIAMRWINKGIAHVVKEEVKSIAQGGIVPKGEITIPLYNDQVLNKIQIEKLKEFKEETDESIIFREPEVIEIDVIEPIPERFTSFEEPKEVKPIKKAKKKNK